MRLYHSACSYAIKCTSHGGNIFQQPTEDVKIAQERAAKISRIELPQREQFKKNLRFEPSFPDFCLSEKGKLSFDNFWPLLKGGIKKGTKRRIFGWILFILHKNVSWAWEPYLWNKFLSKITFFRWRYLVGSCCCWEFEIRLQIDFKIKQSIFKMKLNKHL